MHQDFYKCAPWCSGPYPTGDCQCGAMAERMRMDDEREDWLDASANEVAFAILVLVNQRLNTEGRGIDQGFKTQEWSEKVRSILKSALK